MNVKCARCGAIYKLSVKTLPPDGMRVKCGACKHVMLIRLKQKGKRPGRALRQARIRDVTTLPPPQVTGGDGARLNDRQSASQVHETPRREEKPTESGPSVIIDMGQLGDEATGEEAPIQAAAPSSDVTFAPLSTTGPHHRPAKDVDPDSTELVRAPDFGDVELGLDDVDIIPVRPPTMWRLWGALLLLTILGLAAYVGWRNDWSRDALSDPITATQIAFGVKQRPKPTPPKPTPIVEAEATRGALELSEPTIELIWTGRTERAAIVRAEVHNNSNRVQKAIGVEAAVLDTRDGLPIKMRVVACCETFDRTEARRVARQADHPHFATTLNHMSSVRLAPGEKRVFSAIIRGLDGGVPAQRFKPRATIKFSESE